MSATIEYTDVEEGIEGFSCHPWYETGSPTRLEILDATKISD